MIEPSAVWRSGSRSSGGSLPTASPTWGPSRPSPAAGAAPGVHARDERRRRLGHRDVGSSPRTLAGPMLQQGTAGRYAELTAESDTPTDQENRHVEAAHYGYRPDAG